MNKKEHILVNLEKFRDDPPPPPPPKKKQNKTKQRQKQKQKTKKKVFYIFTNDLLKWKFLCRYDIK